RRSLAACVLRTVEIREGSTPVRRLFAAGAQLVAELRCLALPSAKWSGGPATVPGRGPTISAERHQARDWREQRLPGAANGPVRSAGAPKRACVQTEVHVAAFRVLKEFLLAPRNHRA